MRVLAGPALRLGLGLVAFPRSPSSLVILLVIATMFPVTALAVASPAAVDAIVIDQGSLARSQVVAIGQDLVVKGTVHGPAAVLGGRATVSGEVGGDLVVIDGDIDLLPGARVRGDVVALGGSIRSAGEVEIEGRSVAYPKASRALLALVELPTLGGRGTRVQVQLGLLLAWWLAAVMLVSTFAGPVSVCAEKVSSQPLRSLFVGVATLLAGALGLLLLARTSPALLTLPLVVLVLVLFLLLKLWGTVAVMLAFGKGAARWTKGLVRDVLGMVLLGLIILGAIKLAPWLGPIVWSAVTLVGMGAAWITRLGTSESAAR